MSYLLYKTWLILIEYAAYSVLNEICHKTVFCFRATEIYQYVKEGQMIPVFRPTLLDSKQDSQGCSEHLASLIRRCWSEDANERPDFGTVKSALKRISKSVKLLTTRSPSHYDM